MNHGSQKEDRTNNQEETKTPTAVWHCFKACNYACEFCYARFEDLKATPVMAANEGCQLLEMLASAGVEKINFVGGEPMLHPHRNMDCPRQESWPDDKYCVEWNQHQ